MLYCTPWVVPVTGGNNRFRYAVRSRQRQRTRKGQIILISKEDILQRQNLPHKPHIVATMDQNRTTNKVLKSRVILMLPSRPKFYEEAVKPGMIAQLRTSRCLQRPPILNQTPHGSKIKPILAAIARRTLEHNSSRLKPRTCIELPTKIQHK
jgi:hypothetical protein